MPWQVGPQRGDCRGGMAGVIAQAAGGAMVHYARWRGSGSTGMGLVGTVGGAGGGLPICRHIRHRQLRPSRGNDLRVVDRGLPCRNILLGTATGQRSGLVVVSLRIDAKRCGCQFSSAAPKPSPGLEVAALRKNVGRVACGDAVRRHFCEQF